MSGNAVGLQLLADLEKHSPNQRSPCHHSPSFGAQLLFCESQWLSAQSEGLVSAKPAPGIPSASLAQRSGSQAHISCVAFFSFLTGASLGQSYSAEYDWCGAVLDLRHTGIPCSGEPDSQPACWV